MRSIRFITLGCRLNQAEEAIFAAEFAGAGWNVCQDESLTDAIVVRSCAVTRQAERSTLQALRSLKLDVGDDVLPFVVVTGCATAAIPIAVLNEAGADLVIAKKDEADLQKIITKALDDGMRAAPVKVRPIATFPTALTDPEMTPIPQATGSIWATPGRTPHCRHKEMALLKVQDGCAFRCSYCIVPFTRGAPISLSAKEAIQGAEDFCKAGFQEIVLTGCNLACYNDGQIGLPELISDICTLAAGYGVNVSLGSIEPGICDDGIIDAMLRHNNLRRFIHLPIQSGDSGVLSLARRRYTGGQIREILQNYRSRLDGLFLSGDFITGLPGEDNEAFLQTYNLVKDFAFDSIHVFPYSPRQGTAALLQGGRPSRTDAKARANILRTLAKDKN